MKLPIKILTLILLMLSSCDFSNYYSAKPQVSESIAESKRRKVFVSAYIPEHNPVMINSDVQIHVKEAWAERNWHVGKDGRTVINQNYQFVVTTTNDVFSKLQDGWTIANDTNAFEIASERIIHCESGFPNEDRETWKIIKGDNPNRDMKHKVVGEFVLVKVKLP